jgi:chemotaxis protein histidine kinase CheA
MKDAFEDRLAALKQQFRVRAMGECETLQRIVVDMARGPPPAQLWEQIRQIAHSLAGAGGTLGFSGISASASVLEDIVSEGRNSSDVIDACQDLIAELKPTA